MGGLFSILLDGLLELVAVLGFLLMMIALLVAWHPVQIWFQGLVRNSWRFENKSKWLSEYLSSQQLVLGLKAVGSWCNYQFKNHLYLWGFVVLPLVCFTSGAFYYLFFVYPSDIKVQFADDQTEIEVVATEDLPGALRSTKGESPINRENFRAGVRAIYAGVGEYPQVGRKQP